MRLQDLVNGPDTPGSSKPYLPMAGLALATVAIVAAFVLNGSTVFPLFLVAAACSLFIYDSLRTRRSLRQNAVQHQQSLESTVRERTEELARTNAELQIARDLLKATLASIGDGVISTDTAGRVVFANAAALGILKMPGQQLSGRLLDEVFRVRDEQTHAEAENPVARVLREGEVAPLSNHTVLVTSDSTEVPIDDCGSPIRGGDGSLQGSVLVFRDVAPRRRAEEASRLLAAIVENSQDAIVSKSLDGIVTSWNRGAERIFGYSAEEMIGHPISRIAPESRHAEMAGILARIQRGERVEEFETVRRKKSGELVAVSVTVSPIADEHGRIIGASKIARDLTERSRALERQAALNRELQHANAVLAAANQDLERFAYIASHDLQEPLRMVTAYSQMLLRTLEPNATSAQRDAVRFVEEGTERMRALLADLLAYSELRGGPGEPPETVDLSTVLHAAWEGLTAQGRTDGATLEAEPLPRVQANRRRLQTVFHHLLENSLKYRSDEVLLIRVRAREDDNEIHVEVCDNGMGIDPEYHSQIFAPFRRLHGREVPGSGIGLAICRRVVELYGGRITVESQSGRGATFRISMPSRAVAALAASNSVRE